MLIIFDLDDTLIDTSSSITPIKLEQTLEYWVLNGLTIPDKANALDLIKRLNSTALTAHDTLVEFLELIDAPKNYLEMGLKILYGDLTDIPVFPLENALNVLTQLRGAHRLALVTCGKKELQFEKMKKAGIDTLIFSKIIVSEERNKLPHYRELLEDFNISPTEGLVCGDRIAIDLTPAKQLGLKTVQMRYGRGLNTKGNPMDVDFTISHLSELLPIIINLNN